MIKKTLFIGLIATSFFCSCSSSQATTEKDNKVKEEPKEDEKPLRDASGKYLR